MVILNVVSSLMKKKNNLLLVYFIDQNWKKTSDQINVVFKLQTFLIIVCVFERFSNNIQIKPYRIRID